MEDDKLFSGKMGRTSLPEMSLILVTWGVIFFQVGPVPQGRMKQGRPAMIGLFLLNQQQQMGRNGHGHVPRDTAEISSPGSAMPGKKLKGFEGMIYYQYLSVFS